MKARINIAHDDGSKEEMRLSDMRGYKYWARNQNGDFEVVEIEECPAG